MSVALPEQPTIPTIPEVLDKLAALGHPDQIALHLQEQGIVAVPCKTNFCAIALYLHQQTGRDVAVGEEHAAVWNSCMPDDLYPLPQSVREFVKLFDGLKYPDLVDWSKRLLGLEGAF